MCGRVDILAKAYVAKVAFSGCTGPTPTPQIRSTELKVLIRSGNICPSPAGGTSFHSLSSVPYMILHHVVLDMRGLYFFLYFA